MTPSLFKAGSFVQYSQKLPDVFKYLPLYYMKLYIGITTSVSLPWSISVLFFALVKSISWVQFLSITFLFVLTRSAPWATLHGTDVVS